MSDKVKYPRAEALAVAKELCQLLQPVSERLKVAGSLRRKRKAVSDVEILYLPRFERRKKDLFDYYQHNLAADVIEAAVESGVLSKRLNTKGHTCWGESNKLAVHVASGIPVDLFQATAGNWFNYLICRTGPKEHNIAITHRASKLGLEWRPTSEGFLDLKTSKPLPVHSEEELYAILEYVHLQPWERSGNFGTKQ